MMREGAQAPAVSLPAYVDGERTRVDLGEYVGEGIVVLAFYPADFNPACTMQSSDLDDLDLFTMQKDVSVFAISPDSTYSHAAFADRYSLHIPLLSDPDGEAAAAYGVATENDIGEQLVERAVFVVDHRGEVRYAWSGEGIESEIDVGPVKEAVGDIGGDDTALERYRVGHDHYVEGREAFRTAMREYEDREWMVAFNEFEAAQPAFAAAADHFDTAVRFAETDDFEAVVDRGEEKADTLQHAADWLADSADALSSGRGKQGKEFRADADRLLSAASDLPDPPAPDAFALTDDGIEIADGVAVDPDADDDEAYAWRAGGDDGVDVGLSVDDADLDAAVAADGPADTDDPESASGGEAADAGDVEGDTVEGDLEMDIEAIEAADDEDASDGTASDGTASDGTASDGDALAGGAPDDGAAAADGEGPATEDERAVGGSAIEGDTVEGDLEMDIEAIEAADEGDSDDGNAGAGATDDDPAGTAEGADEADDDAPLLRGGSPDDAAGERPGADPAANGQSTDGTRTSGGAGGADTVDDAGPDGSETAGDDDSSAPSEEGRTGDAGDGDTGGDDTGSDDTGGDDTGGDDDIEELDLADPTEGDDGEDEDEERADWDVPGQ